MHWLRRYRSEIGLIVFFAALLGLTLAHHEPWRDEMHYWMSPRDSRSLWDCWEHRRYDGHPPLWNFVLFFSSRLTGEVWMMQLTHWLVCLAALVVFVFKSPFSYGLKAAILAGYYPAFEYSVISRNYGLGMLWLWVFCLLCSKPNKRYWPLAVILILMSQTNVHIFLLGSAFMLGLAGQLASQSELRRSTPKWDIALTTGLSMVAAGLLLWVTRLPVDTCYPQGATLDWNLPRFCRVLASLWQAFVPLPMPTVQFHDSNILNHYDLRWIAVISAALWCAAHLSLRQPLSRRIHWIGTLLFLAFAYTKMLGFYRHIGHHYLLWLACLWIDFSPALRHALWGRIFLWSTLAVQFVAALIAITLDLLHPFSTARQAAIILQHEDLKDLPIVVLSDYIVEPVVGWIERPVYSLEARRWWNYVISNLPLDPPPPPKDSLKQIKSLAQSSGKDVLLLWDQTVDFPPMAGVTVQRIAVIEPGIIASEKYAIYRFHFQEPLK